MAARAGIAMIATILSTCFWYLPSLWFVNWVLGPQGRTSPDDIFIAPGWTSPGYWDTDRQLYAFGLSILMTAITWAASVWFVQQFDPEIDDVEIADEMEG